MPPIDHMLNKARFFDIYYRANHAEAGEEYTDDIDEQPINVIGFNEIHQSKKFWITIRTNNDREEKSKNAALISNFQGKLDYGTAINFSSKN